jgi:hypothetical protein
MYYIYAIIMLLIIILILQLHSFFQKYFWIRSGLYPEEGKATMLDVERLAKEGHHMMAITCHREVTASSLKEAKRAVELIENK